jgi:hypothetical protein
MKAHPYLANSARPPIIVIRLASLKEIVGHASESTSARRSSKNSNRRSFPHWG